MKDENAINIAVKGGEEIKDAQIQEMQAFLAKEGLSQQKIDVYTQVVIKDLPEIFERCKANGLQVVFAVQPCANAISLSSYQNADECGVPAPVLYAASKVLKEGIDILVLELALEALRSTDRQIGLLKALSAALGEVK